MFGRTECLGSCVVLVAIQLEMNLTRADTHTTVQMCVGGATFRFAVSNDFGAAASSVLDWFQVATAVSLFNVSERIVHCSLRRKPKGQYGVFPDRRSRQSSVFVALALQTVTLVPGCQNQPGSFFGAAAGVQQSAAATRDTGKTSNLCE